MMWYADQKAQQTHLCSWEKGAQFQMSVLLENKESSAQSLVMRRKNLFYKHNETFCTYYIPYVLGQWEVLVSAYNGAVNHYITYIYCFSEKLIFYLVFWQ